MPDLFVPQLARIDRLVRLRLADRVRAVLKAEDAREFGLPDGRELANVIHEGYYAAIERAVEYVDDRGLTFANLTTRLQTALADEVAGLSTVCAAALPPLWEAGHDRMVALLAPIIRSHRQRPHKAIGFELPDVALEDFDWADWRVVSRHLAPAIQRQAHNFCASTLATTSKRADEAYAALKRALHEGIVTEGEALPVLRQRVQGVFEDMTRAKAQQIAQTEASRAYHAAGDAAARESEVVSGWEWVSSSDACFAAGSKLLKVTDGLVSQVGIETLVVGDMVIGGSGKPCRVLAVASKPYRGDMIEGPDFRATPDHWFLTRDGWRPVGEYACQTFVRGFLDLDISETQDVPAALFQVSGLAPILPDDFRLGVPVDSIGEDDQMEIVDGEINDPAVVHRNLFPESDSRRTKQVGHQDFNVRSLGSSHVRINSGAVLGTEIALASSSGADAARMLREGFTASATDTRNPVLSDRTAITQHRLTVRLVRALARAKLFSLVSGLIPYGRENLAAHTARLIQVSRDRRIGTKRQCFAFATTKTSASRNGAGESLISFPALLTGSHRVFLSVQQSAGIATEPSRFPVAGADIVRLSAFFADGIRRFLFGQAKACGAAIFRMVATVMAWGRRERRSALQAFQENELFHGESVPRLWTLVNVDPCLVYDIQVEEDASFLLPCGLIAHNCPRCLEISAKCPRVKIGQNFARVGENPTYRDVPYPPLHPACNCSCVPVIAHVYGGPADAEYGETLIDPEGMPADYVPPPLVIPPIPAPPTHETPALVPVIKPVPIGSYANLGVRFTPDATALEHGDPTVVVNVAKLDAAWRRDKGYYVGPGGTGPSAKGGAYANALAYLERARAEGLPFDMGRIFIDADGVVSFLDGRHRFAVLRDLGVTDLPVSVDAEQLALALELFGVDATGEVL